MKRIIISICIFVVSQSLIAQTLTPSQKRDQRLVEEAEKKSAASASLLSDKFDTHSASIKDVPKRFENESVVILFHSSNFFIERGEVINFVERVKIRVYLKDKAAVEKYSTYYTSGYGESNSSNVTIIKANGISRKLELEDGIKETNYANIPLYYKSSVMMNQTYYKFALPDLEPGDIIDFTQISKNPMGILTGNIPFSRIYLTSDFPIVKTFITIEVPTKDSYMYIKSLNGAPELTQKQGADGLVTFTLEDSLREKVLNDWKLPREKYLPHVKFILTRYTGTDNNQVIPVRTVDKRIHTTFSDEDFVKTAILFKELRSLGAGAAKIVMDAVIEKNPEAKTDINKLMELSWYYVRKKLINQETISYYESYISGPQFDMYVANLFIEILTIKKQTYDLILTTGNQSCGIKNVISPIEITWGIKWNGKYIMYPTYYMQFGELPNSYQGADGLISTNFNFKLKTFTFSNFIFPSELPKDNLLSEKYNISINEDFEKITCKRTLEASKGYSGTFIKDYYDRDFTNDQLKYLKMYEVTDSSLLYKGMNNVKAAELKRKNNELQADYFKSVKDSHAELIKEEYSTMDVYTSWNFNGYGMTPNSPKFSIDEVFTLNDLVKKAGNGYMVRIGALFGTYNKVDDDFRKRSNPGSMDLVSTKTASITFEIPEGYKVSSLETANKSFSDGFVTMESSLTIEGNTVVLKVMRDIKKLDFTLEEYPSMVKYYDMMYELTQTQIVLKKK